MIRPEDEALIQSTIRGIPTRELIRARGKDWSLEQIDYAMSRIQDDTLEQQRGRAETLLRELREDRAREILFAESERKATERQAATEAALSELRNAVKQGPKPHWTQSPGFWVALVAAVAAIIAAWPVVRDWLR